ncbi:RNase H1/viroplasmin domain-containing protein [Turicibacter sp.]|uniref:RNase H1/viroplasmin domain-containing protein n=1 Tax=Turicibacter sp. TaxID=2049042 RepID=UPI001B519D14|nr:RNase H1/viroplasmin domain-containing protein [Turicibacter sp.]MBP3905056.1 RNase H1/viroplasmin domain-containing protein [Turicibacter sp.]MBP3908037.1 RNase H1/viroplasmin domain-containing protein [Turicibacter sp.]
MAKRKSKSNKQQVTKYYAVKEGRESNVIVLSWSECKKLVHKFPKAKYKSFETLVDAQNYLATEQIHMATDKQMSYLNDLASEGGYVVKTAPTTVQATKLIKFLLGEGGEPACLFEILEFEI